MRFEKKSFKPLLCCESRQNCPTWIEVRIAPRVVLPLLTPHSSIPSPARSTPQLPAESQRNAPRTAQSQRTLVQWYTGSTTVHKKGSAPRVIPAVGPPKPVGPPKHECCYKSKGCQMSSDHAPAVASHEKCCSFKPQGSVVATMKTPFCLDAQIRRREQLNELTEQLESAVSEEAQSAAIGYIHQCLKR